jgi:hypothetical protein
LWLPDVALWFGVPRGAGLRPLAESILQFVFLPPALELLAFLAARSVVVVFLVDQRIFLVRDAGNISSRFAVVVVAGTCVIMPL